MSRIRLILSFLCLLLCPHLFGQSPEVILKQDISLSEGNPEYTWLGKTLDFSGSFELSFLVQMEPKAYVSIALSVQQTPTGSDRKMKVSIVPNEDDSLSQIDFDAMSLYTYVYDDSYSKESLRDGKLHRITTRVTKNDARHYLFDLILDGKLLRRFGIPREKFFNFEQVIAQESNMGLFEIKSSGEGSLHLKEVTFQKLPEKKYFLNVAAFGIPRYTKKVSYNGAAFVQLLTVENKQVQEKAYGYYPRTTGITPFSEVPSAISFEHLPVPFQPGNDGMNVFRSEISALEYDKVLALLNKWLIDPKRKPFSPKNSLELIKSVAYTANSSVHIDDYSDVQNSAYGLVAWLEGSPENDNEELYDLEFAKPQPRTEEPTLATIFCGKYELQEFFPCPCPPNHDYTLSRVICTKKDNPYCTVDNVFRHMISNIDYMAPASIEAITYPKGIYVIHNKMYYVAPSTTQVYETVPPDAQLVEHPEEVRSKQDVIRRRNQGNHVCDCKETMLVGWDIEKISKLPDGLLSTINPVEGFTVQRNNPIVSGVNVQQHVAVNRSLPGHALYPGKVTRQVVEENGQVVIKTRGVGGTPLYETNLKLGDLFFSRIDNNLWLDFNVIANSPELQKLVKDQPCPAQDQPAIKRK